MPRSCASTLTSNIARTILSHPLASTIDPSDLSYPISAPSIRRPATDRSSTGRPRTRPSTSTTTYNTSTEQQIICAVTESRGVSPTVGLAYINLSTSQAVLCQIADTQTYTRTIHKLWIWAPTVLLLPSTAADPSKSKLMVFLESMPHEVYPTTVHRKYFSESEGQELVEQLVFRDDLESTKVAIEGKFYAVACFSAVLQYARHDYDVTFAPHTLRIRYEPSDGAMMIDLSTIHSLELIQNLHDARSKDCLFGLLNETLTPMGSRLLRSNILQPLLDKEIIEKRYEALEELTTREDIFLAVRNALKDFLDVDKVLTNLIVTPGQQHLLQWLEQGMNHILVLKQYVTVISPVFEALQTAASGLLRQICDACGPETYANVAQIIDVALNEDAMYAKKPLELRNQRMYAMKAGNNGLLDVARQAYRETVDDVHEHCKELAQIHELGLELAFDNKRSYYLRFPPHELEGRTLDVSVFLNACKTKRWIECQTMDLMKLNNKLACSHQEVMNMSMNAVQALIENIRTDIAPLFRISDSIALLDLLASLAQVATKYDYIRPQIRSSLALKASRHPIRIKISPNKFIPNDCYAGSNSRLQILTGCNMSGKSTYIRTIALLQVMAQIGSFVPAEYAGLPIREQLFARVSTDDNISANVSTFAAEMRETAFILRNINENSLAIIDELGRGTSTTDGLAIAIAIAEALLNSQALVFFVTHFHELARFLADRPGVTNLHLAVDMQRDANRMLMLYKIAAGPVTETSYGISLARVANLPSTVIEDAQRAAEIIRRKKQRTKHNSRAHIQVKKRKLLLGLRDQLRFAKESNMEGEELRRWMKALQDEFVIRMTSLEDAEERILHAQGLREDMVTETTGSISPTTPSCAASTSTVRPHSDSSSTKALSWYRNANNSEDCMLSHDENAVIGQELTGNEEPYMMHGALPSSEDLPPEEGETVCGLASGDSDTASSLTGENWEKSDPEVVISIEDE